MKKNDAHTITELVSVIIPCFNRDSFIAETVNSVLNQTWPNIELIVVDDGCTDDSRKILESFGLRLTILEHPGRVNKGQSASINLGIQNCNGEYVAILDSDDLFLPDKIQRQVSFMKANPQIGLVYSNGYAIDSAGNVLYEFYGKNHKEDSDPNRVLLDCYFLLPNNSLVRRQVFEKVGGFDEGLRTAQDHDMAIRVSEITKLAYLGDYLFCYRRHKDSISNNRTMERWKNGFKILEAARKRYPYPATTVRHRKAVLNFRLGQCYMQKKSYLNAVYYLLLAGVLDPVRSLKVILGMERLTGPQ